MWSLSNKLTEYYVRNNSVDEDKIEIYRYGFKLIISDIINFLIVLVIGFSVKKSLESILFLTVLCSVRRFSGGFHAKTFIVCRISMIFTLICVMLFSNLITVYINVIFIISLIINCLSVLVIFWLAPVENKNKPLSERQRKINRKKAVIISLIWSTISLVMIAVDIIEGITISLTLLAVVLLMIVSLLLGKRGEQNV